MAGAIWKQTTQPKTAKSVRSVEIPTELRNFFTSRKEGPIFTSLQGNRIQANKINFFQINNLLKDRKRNLKFT